MPKKMKGYSLSGAPRIIGNSLDRNEKRTKEKRQIHLVKDVSMVAFELRDSNLSPSDVDVINGILGRKLSILCSFHTYGY